MRNRDKPELVRRFILGRSLSDTAAFFGVSHWTAEGVIREAITQLSVLNAKLGERINSQVAEQAAQAHDPSEYVPVTVNDRTRIDIPYPENS